MQHPRHQQLPRRQLSWHRLGPAIALCAGHCWMSMVCMLVMRLPETRIGVAGSSQRHCSASQQRRRQRPRHARAHEVQHASRMTHARAPAGIQDRIPWRASGGPHKGVEGSDLAPQDPPGVVGLVPLDAAMVVGLALAPAEALAKTWMQV